MQLNSNHKEKLIEDIQKLLNSYKGISTTQIDSNLLAYMEEKELKKIIDDLLTQKEKLLESNQEWLEQFKKQQ